MNENIGCAQAWVGGRDLHRGKTLRSVEEKGESAEGGGLTRDIGCPDVATTTAADILAAEDTDEEITERDRPEEIAGDEGEDYFLHAFSCQDAGAAPAPPSALPQPEPRQLGVL